MSFEDNDYTSINVVPVVDLPDKVRLQDVRVEHILAAYQRKFSASPLFVIRVPGRVNLIGEHIDYCGYSVFPMALQQNIMMAVGLGGTVPIRMANTDSQYPDVSIELADIEFPKQIKWYHYFLCGYKGVVDKYCEGAQCPPINVMVDGNIPPASGLSSSSAMVVASAMTTLISYYQSLCEWLLFIIYHYLIYFILVKISTPIPKLEIALLCIKCERYIGTDSGGMDQAIAILAEEGSAKIIDFIPNLNATNVQLPTGVSFYIAHSGVSMHKAATAHYNTRVAETKLAAAFIAKRLKIAGYKLGDQLWVVQQASAIPLAEIGEQLANIFDVNKDSYNRTEICSILGELTEIYLYL